MRLKQFTVYIYEESKFITAVPIFGYDDSAAVAIMNKIKEELKTDKVMSYKIVEVPSMSEVKNV